MRSIRVSSEQDLRDLVNTKSTGEFTTAAFRLQDIVLEGLDLSSVKLVTMPKKSFFRNVVFRKCTFSFFQVSQCVMDSVFFDDCRFVGDVHITEEETPLIDVEFRHCLFMQSVLFAGGTTISKCIFRESVTCWGVGVTISSCEIRMQLTLNKIQRGRFVGVTASKIEMHGITNSEFNVVKVKGIFWFSPLDPVTDNTFQSVQAKFLGLYGVTVRNTNFWDCEFEDRALEGSLLDTVDFHNSYITVFDLQYAKQSVNVNIY